MDECDILAPVTMIILGNGANADVEAHHEAILAQLRERASEPNLPAAPVEITADVMPGVVSLPHGWGHDDPGAQLSVASAHAGVNSNVLTDELPIDLLSGNGVLNGIPVEVEPA